MNAKSSCPSRRPAGRTPSTAVVVAAQFETLEPRRLFTAITSGERLIGAISAVGEVDSFELTLSSGDRFSFVVGDTNDTFLSPRLEVFAPGGTSMGMVSNSLGSALDLVATVDGVYTAQVRDNTNNNTGPYAISAFRAPGTQPTDADSGPISSGRSYVGTVQLGDLDVYTFNAGAGDHVTLLLGDVNDTFYSPRLTLYAPDGKVFKDAVGGIGAVIETTPAEPLTQSGRYTAVVRDSTAVNSGSYRLSLVHVPEAQPIEADSGPLAGGARRYGTLDIGDLDVYTFDAVAGDAFILNVSDNRDTFLSPRVSVYAPNGVLVTTSTAGVTASIDASSLVQAGTYVVVIREEGADTSGEYAITLTKMPGLPAGGEADGDGGALGSGQTLTASIPLGDLDLYSISLTGGTSHTFRMSELGNTFFSPELTFYGPDGLFIASDIDGLSAVITETVPVTGTYYLVARDDGDDSVGKYALAVDAAVGGTDTRPPVVTAANFNALLPAHRVTLQLNESIAGTFAESDVLVRNLALGNMPTSDYVAVYDDVSHRITIEFNAFPNGTLPDGNYRVTLRGGFVADTAGNPLAADYVFEFSVPGAPTLVQWTVDDGSAQRSRVSRLAVTFNQSVALAAGAVRLDLLNTGGSGQNDNSVPTDASAALATPTTPDNGKTWVFTFAAGSGFVQKTGAGVSTGGLIDGIYRLSVDPAKVTANGVAMATAPAPFTFHRLFGDIDGNKAVSNLDFAQFRNTFNKTSGEPAYNPAFDFDNNGSVNNLDFAQFRGRYGKAFTY